MTRLVLILIVLSTIGCSQTIVSENDVRVVDELDQLSPSQILCSDIEGKARITTERRISFEKVNFSLDDEWIRDVKYYVIPECVLTGDEIKPDGIGGRTVEFYLRYNFSSDEAQISVFKIEDYKNAFAGHQQYVGRRDAELKSIIEGGSKLTTFGVKPPPHVRWMDAHEVFYAKAAKIDFINGRGVLIVTQISQDAFMAVSNSNLEFLFQGFTSDGEYFVEMNFPAKLKGLPEDGEQFRSKFGAGSTGFNLPEHIAAYERYILKTAAQIDKARSADFRPELSQIEKFIRSFGIK